MIMRVIRLLGYCFTFAFYGICDFVLPCVECGFGLRPPRSQNVAFAIGVFFGVYVYATAYNANWFKWDGTLLENRLGDSDVPHPSSLISLGESIVMVLTSFMNLFFAVVKAVRACVTILLERWFLFLIIISVRSIL